MMLELLKECRILEVDSLEVAHAFLPWLGAQSPMVIFEDVFGEA
jgi:hypothetical protein